MNPEAGVKDCAGIDHRDTSGRGGRSELGNLFHASIVTDGVAISKAEVDRPQYTRRMKTRRIRLGPAAGGAALALAGTVWALQGAGVLGGSAMSDNTTWVLIGVLVAALGVWLAWRGVTPR